MNEREHKKVTFSKSILKSALIRIMKTKPLDRIGVSELCKEAGVNRSTFYAHYETITDLVEEIELEFLDQIPALNSELSDKQLIKELTVYTSFVREHPDAFNILVDNGYIMPKYYKRWISEQEQFLEHDQESGMIREQISLIANYTIAGITQAYKRWLTEGEYLSAEDFAYFIVQTYRATYKIKFKTNK